MRKQPLFDVSRFNHIADKYDIPWIDRIPLIETICWGSKGWLDSDLLEKIDGRWRGSRKNGQYARFMVAILHAHSAGCEHKFPPKDCKAPKGYQFA